MKQAMGNSGGEGVSGGAVSNSLNDCLNGIEDPRTDYSTIRGKKVLVSPNEEQFELLKKRLEERTQDSRGETIYEIGVGEDGGDSGLDEDEYQAAVATLQSLATTIDADMVLLRQRKVEKGLTGQYLIRKRVDTSDFMEIR
ncbi:hypothetical protein DOY81_014610 [Sarcophaga bullata]|nr:hypothetical protein DOY81_014610 [Sarcophaga bullata]